jgi:ribonuclease T2
MKALTTFLKRTLTLLAVLSLWLLAMPQSAGAFEAMSDQFVANRACAALPTIRGNQNPGNIQLKPQQSYQVIGKNKANPTHYQIKVPGAVPENRWVATNCGKLTGQTGTVASRKEFLLALSWQPSFCETKPGKPECQTQTAQRFDATNLALHGLWPQPRDNAYCGVSQQIIQLDKDNQWSSLPPINLSVSTRNALAERMPGFTSNLHLHEWYKHGTCYSSSPEKYFQESMALQDQVNNSSVQDLFERNIGQYLEATTIRNEFDRAFGQGAGARVQIQCQKDIDQDQNNMVVELQLNLKGTIQPSTPIKGLLLAGKTVPAGCSRGEVDPAGVNQ